MKSSRKLPVFVAYHCVRIRKLKEQIKTINVTVQFGHVHRHTVQLILAPEDYQKSKFSITAGYKVHAS